MSRTVRAGGSQGLFGNGIGRIPLDGEPFRSVSLSQEAPMTEEEYAERRRALEPIGGADVRVSPIHHGDARGKPQQEDEAERDAQPSMYEDGEPLEHAGQGYYVRG